MHNTTYNGFKSYSFSFFFSHFLIARMKDQSTTDRQLVRLCTCIYDCCITDMPKYCY